MCVLGIIVVDSVAEGSEPSPEESGSSRCWRVTEMEKHGQRSGCKVPRELWPAGLSGPRMARNVCIRSTTWWAPVVSKVLLGFGEQSESGDESTVGVTGWPSTVTSQGQPVGAVAWVQAHA